MKLKSAAVAAATALAWLLTSATPAVADGVRDKQWHLRYLKIDQAHEISDGQGVKVAVIDSGISRHPDLSGNIARGTDFVDEGGDGTEDVDGHGTAMAGLIAGQGENNAGVLGIAPKATVIPIRVIRKGDVDAPLTQAVDWAVNAGASVINISVGGGAEPGIFEALKRAREADVVVVAAAGNKPRQTRVEAPAFVDSVIAVGATGKTGDIAPVSVTGPEIDVVAPGEDLETAGLHGGYITGTGTSGSTAIVSGAVALIRSKYPNLKADQVIDLLERTAVDKGKPGVDDEYGHGVIDIVAALKAGAQPPTTVAAPATANSPPATAPSALGEAEERRTGNVVPWVVGGLVVLVVLGAVGAVVVLNRRTRSR